MKVAVIGGGISGLAAAWELKGRAEVTVFEPGRLGGKILTEDFDGHPVDCGPDSFITRDPAASELAAELGLADELVAPAASGVLLWSGGRLRRLPEGLMLGTPRRLLPLALSGILSPAGVARAALGVLPTARVGRLRGAGGDEGDLGVRELVARRYGAQVADRLVAPLVGSIHACPIDEVSARATVPQLLAPPAGIGRRRRAPASAAAGGRGPAFLAPRAGMGALVERLSAGVQVVALRVEGVVKDGARLRVEPAGEAFDAAVVAVPAAEAALMLDEAELKAIEAASVAVVTLGYAGLELPGGLSGVLIDSDNSPPVLTTAISFASVKWPHNASPGRSVLRVSVGRAGDERWLALDDEALVERVASETSRILATSAVPDRARVNRWAGSFPIYKVGHLALLRRIETSLRRSIPSVRLCGASYRGAGVAACICSGRAAAAEVLA
jgi:oxygen-dependent protoporphyrinogen oxidase